MEFNHDPVLLKEAVVALNIKRDGAYIDCTVGGGGHSFEIARNLDFDNSAKLICFDRDETAINAAKKKLEAFPVTFINANFSEMGSYGIGSADGILMDLGVSSAQLDNSERGFSFHEDADLDMRMGANSLSAYEIVNDYSEDKLVKILFEYGEEKYARNIVKAIIKARETAPIKTTLELAEIIKRNVPLSVRKAKNPCRKTFQALRIEANDELNSIEKGIKTGFDLLNKNGRLAIITFHSVEDRLVKNKFAEFTAGCDCPKNLPLCVCGKSPKALSVTRKPIVASEEEVLRNKRARSAKLRVLEKIVD